MGRRTRLVQTSEKHPAEPVEARRVNPDALREALRIANGDTSRLRFTEDGGVMVVNQPRLPYRED